MIRRPARAAIERGKLRFVAPECRCTRLVRDISLVVAFMGKLLTLVGSSVLINSAFVHRPHASLKQRCFMSLPVKGAFETKYVATFKQRVTSRNELSKILPLKAPFLQAHASTQQPDLKARPHQNVIEHKKASSSQPPHDGVLSMTGTRMQRTHPNTSRLYAYNEL
jgi:hypothetical protein